MLTHSSLSSGTVLVVVALVVAGFVCVNLPLPWRPLGVSSASDRTVIRAHGWMLAPVALAVGMVWAAWPHLGRPSDMWWPVGGMVAACAAASWLAWRHGRAEFSPERVVTRGSLYGSRARAVYHAGAAMTSRIGMGPTRALFRPRGVMLGLRRSETGEIESGPECYAMFGILRGEVWALRALREVARAGHWPRGMRLITTHEFGPLARRIAADLQACGVPIEYELVPRRGRRLR
ncbi:hypothetical protein [Bogoriella caseilytica]|uniref:Uncharacterized protein n=1 Tax=Bogoriella caseilytica TaxID=56055 RepID=A0A3N2BF35_9MICO|nr:hypothetical protein [Bogoriella caseilytica]ROR73845.1 hypothetical protein EDD31_2236 [Bogoriella caseilytica]